MSDFTNRIDTLLTATHQRRADMCRGTGIPDSTVRNWIRGRIPQIDAAIKIAAYFGCSLDYLLTGKNPEEVEQLKSCKLSDAEDDLINYFRLLNNRDQEFLLLTARSLFTRAKEEKKAGDISARNIS